jgi:K+-transporting ATPase ATPase A chain
VLQRLESALPLNPAALGAALTPDLAFNTAVSFPTNTNWQAYSGESMMSYLVPMVALTVQNFASAAAGVAVALVCGFVRQQATTIGNFWVDLTRAVLYLFLPLSLLGALFSCSQGVIQNLAPYTDATTMEGNRQVIAQGPVASQEAIKMLGTNGGGFFNANSAHPFENPTPLTNLVQMLMIFLISAGLTYTLGRMADDQRQGWAIFAAKSLLFLVGVFVVYAAEQAGNPNLARVGIETSASDLQHLGNMEGKEVRLGITMTSLFATITTAASCSAANGMQDSFTPLGGLVTLFIIQSGEVIFGGICCRPSHVGPGPGRCPRRLVPYRDKIFEAMDTEASLARPPEICLVEELPHTNVPGSPRAKRWEDVLVLFEAGVDVITTMNTQHLDSLNDQVREISGIQV